MKKLITFLCVIALFIPALCMSISAAEPITIWKTATAPKIDCELEDSYKLIADSKKNPALFDIKNKQNVKNHVEIYACWDNDYLYLYVKADCNDPHIAYQDDAEKHYIFNAHYLMTALCPDDSSQEKYKGSNDDKGGWDWNSLYNKNYLYEWTTIYDSKNNAKKISDHFGTISTKTGFEYQTKSEKSFDIYEQKIPFKQLTTSVVSGGLKAAKGTVFGLGASVGFVDVGTDYKENDQVNTNLSKYFEGKNLNAMQLCKLDSNLNEQEESQLTSSVASSQITSSAASSAASSAVSSAANNSTAPSSQTESSKPTSSSVESEIGESEPFEYWWLIITGTAVVIATVVIVLIVRKRNKQ